jgi:hypothetical protein
VACGGNASRCLTTAGEPCRASPRRCPSARPGTCCYQCLTAITG